MSLFDPIRREAVRIGAELGKIFAPGEKAATVVLCPRCEKEMEPGHECANKNLSRRVFFGLMGATSVALAARLDGVPIPGARIEVYAYAGDLFEVESAKLITLAYEDAKDLKGQPFKNDMGEIVPGHILTFTPQDLKAGDMRVHRGLKEMRILGLRDEVTGKPVKYRLIRAAEVDLKRKNLSKLAAEQEKRYHERFDHWTKLQEAQRAHLEKQLHEVEERLRQHAEIAKDHKRHVALERKRGLPFNGGAPAKGAIVRSAKLPYGGRAEIAYLNSDEIRLRIWERDTRKANADVTGKQRLLKDITFARVEARGVATRRGEEEARVVMSLLHECESVAERAGERTVGLAPIGRALLV